jgi:exonuclease VII small subunit
VNDVTKSRDRWREERDALSERIRELETKNAALEDQLAALKKDG